MFGTMFGEAKRSRRCVNAFGGCRAQEHAKHMNTRFNFKTSYFCGQHVGNIQVSLKGALKFVRLCY